jgi:lysophospholipase L1-like esterase
LSLLTSSTPAVDFGDVMPLGDSITAGFYVNGGYRDPIYTLLSAQGHTLDFVGTVNNWPTAALTGAGQQNHEGHSGYIIDGRGPGAPRAGLYENLGSWMGPSGANRPNEILLMIGTNDMNTGYEVAKAPARLDALIDRIYALEPGVRLVVGSVVPSSHASTEANVRSLNASIPGLVAKQRGAGRDVWFADLYNALDVRTDLGDTLHPNPQGYTRLGGAFARAMQNAGSPQITVTGVNVSAETDNSVAAGLATAGAYAPDIRADDLIDTHSATLKSWTRNVTPFFETTTLNDGVGHTSTSSIGTYLPATFSGGRLPATYTFVLNTDTNSLGYDITSIVSFAGWNQNGAALGDQKYELLVSRVGDDAFQSLGVFEYSPFSSSATAEAGATRMALASNTGLIARGVDALRFVLMDPGKKTGIDGTVYFEIDAYGMATVPEPSALLLSLLGCSPLGLLLFARRRAQK